MTRRKVMTIGDKKIEMSEVRAFIAVLLTVAVVLGMFTERIQADKVVDLAELAFIFYFVGKSVAPAKAT
jgi:hypothetical protein